MSNSFKNPRVNLFCSHDVNMFRNYKSSWLIWRWHLEPQTTEWSSENTIITQVEYRNSSENKQMRKVVKLFHWLQQFWYIKIMDQNYRTSAVLWVNIKTSAINGFGPKEPKCQQNCRPWQLNGWHLVSPMYCFGSAKITTELLQGPAVLLSCKFCLGPKPSIELLR